MECAGTAAQPVTAGHCLVAHLCMCAAPASVSMHHCAFFLPAAVPLVRRICEEMGESFQLNEYDRFTKLTVSAALFMRSAEHHNASCYAALRHVRAVLCRVALPLACQRLAASCNQTYSPLKGHVQRADVRC